MIPVRFESTETVIQLVTQICQNALRCEDVAQDRDVGVILGPLPPNVMGTPQNDHDTPIRLEGLSEDRNTVLQLCWHAFATREIICGPKHQYGLIQRRGTWQGGRKILLEKKSSFAPPLHSR